MAESKLRTLSIDFAVQILNLVKFLKSQHETIVSNQIGRAGTSIGANIHEAQYAHGRADFVSKIIVTVDEFQFDGDETSQDRMARSIVALNDGETVQWVLADNSVAQVTKEQLRQALRLAGEAQTAIWADPYTKSE